MKHDCIPKDWEINYLYHAYTVKTKFVIIDWIICIQLQSFKLHGHAVDAITLFHV